MDERTKENSFGFKHMGEGVVGLGFNFGEVESYIPLFKAVLSQESLGRSSEKALELLRLDFEKREEVVSKIEIEIQRVMEHVRCVNAPIVKDEESRRKEFDKLTHGRSRDSRSEKENMRIDEISEEGDRLRKQLMQNTDMLKMKSLNETVSTNEQVALALIVYDVEGWRKDRDGKNIVEFKLGLVSRSKNNPKKFQVDSLTIAEADVFGDNIKPVIHSAKRREEGDLGNKDIIPIVVASSSNKLLGTGIK